MKESVKIVNKIVKNYTFITGVLEENMRLDEDLGLDSLKRTQIICDLEEQMNIEIDLDDLQPCNFLTVKSLCKLADKYKEQAGGA